MFTNVNKSCVHQTKVDRSQDLFRAVYEKIISAARMSHKLRMEARFPELRDARGKFLETARTENCGYFLSCRAAACSSLLAIST